MMKNCMLHTFDAHEIWGEKAKSAEIVESADCPFCQVAAGLSTSAKKLPAGKLPLMGKLPAPKPDEVKPHEGPLEPAIEPRGKPDKSKE